MQNIVQDSINHLGKGGMSPVNTTAASTILKDGTIISTKPGSSNTWYQDIVYRCDGDIVYTAMHRFYLENLVMPGSNIVLKYSNEYFEYLFEGVVQDIRPDYPGYVIIKVNTIGELINTRVFPRTETYLASVLKTSWDEKSRFGVVTNIGLGGAALVSRHDFDYGEEADICIYLDENDRIETKGKMIRKGQKGSSFEYSMQFSEISESASRLLSEFMIALEEESARIQTDFFDNTKDRLKITQ